MKLKLLLIGLIVGGFLYNGSGFAQTMDGDSMIERVHIVKKSKVKKTKVKKKHSKKHTKKFKKKKAKKKKSR